MPAYPSPGDAIAWAVAQTDAQRIVEERFPVVFELTSTAAKTAFRAGTNPLLSVDSTYLKIMELLAVDPRNYTSPIDAADALLAEIDSAWAASGYSATFPYAVKLIGFPGSYNWQRRSCFPSLWAHPDDTPAGMISSEYYCPDPRLAWGGKPLVVASTADSTHITVNTAGKNDLATYPSDWLTWGYGYIIVGDIHGTNEELRVSAYNVSTGEITLSDARTLALNPGDTVQFYRHYGSTGHPWCPPPFIKNGIGPVQTYFNSFIDRIVANMPTHLGVTCPAPRRFVFTDETDTVAAQLWYYDSVAGESRFTPIIGDSRATDSTFTIDGTLTLSDWCGLYKPWTSEPTSYANPYDPRNSAKRDFGNITYNTLRGRAMDAAIYAKIRSAFPGTQYGAYTGGSHVGTVTAPYRDQPGGPATLGGALGSAWGNAIAYDQPNYTNPLWIPRKAAVSGTPTYEYTDYAANGMTAGWDILQAWLDYYSEASDATGVYNAASKLMSDIGRAYLSAMPGKRRGAFLELGPYDTVADSISADYAYPGSAITMADGIFTPSQWANGFMARLVENGTNEFVMFAPGVESFLQSYADALSALHTKIDAAWSALEAIADPPEPVVGDRSDNFNRADGAPGTPSDGGSDWVTDQAYDTVGTPNGGALAVSSNTIKIGTAPSSSSLSPTAVLETGSNVAAVSTTVAVVNAGSSYGMKHILRWIDNANYVYVYWQVSSGNAQIVTRTAHAEATIATITGTGAISAGNVLGSRVDESGNVIVSRNGVDFGSPTAIGSTWDTGTKHGVAFRGLYTVNAIDDITITVPSTGTAAPTNAAIRVVLGMLD